MDTLGVNRISMVQSITDFGDTKQIVLQAVTDEANKTWAKWTPCGKIEMSINNPDAFNQFSPGQTFFVDFSPAPEKQADEK